MPLDTSPGEETKIAGVDWMPWLTEKKYRIAEGLAAVAAELHRVEHLLPSESSSDLWYQLDWVASNALRLWSDAYGNLGRMQASDTDILLHQPQGFKELRSRYNSTDEPVDTYSIRTIPAFITEVELYLDGPRGENRTALEAIVLRCKIDHPYITQFKQNLDDVSMNLLSWEEFVLFANSLVRRLRQI